MISCYLFLQVADTNPHMGLIKDLLIRYREAVLYVFFGGLTTLVSWGTYYVMAKWLEWDLNLSNVLSWVIGVLFAFAVNKWFVFEAKSRDKKVVSKEITLFIGGRLLTGVVAWLLFPVLLYIGMDQALFGTPGMVAKIVVTVVEVALNWVISKYVVFTQKSAE